MKAEHEILLPLDERNFAHVLAALALTGIAAEQVGECDECRCWWNGDGFRIRSTLSELTLIENANRFIRGLRWIPGLGASKGKTAAEKCHGTFVSENRVGLNPFISLSEREGENSLLKTFASHQEPGCGVGIQPSDKHILENQLKQFKAESDDLCSWLLQRGYGVTSWGFDSSVGSHAYDLGFTSDGEGSGKADPIYTAIELLSLGGASFFSTPHTWQVDDTKITYAIWQDRISFALAPLAAARLLEGLQSNHYIVASRGNAYGKGAAFRYFPEASPITNHNKP